MYRKFLTAICFIMLLLNASSFAQNDSITKNLIHSWKFDDGTARDYISGINGILKGAAKISNGSLNTEKTNSWLELPAKSIEINKYHELTFEIWFKSVPNGNPGFHMITSFGDTRNSLGVNYFFMTPAREDNKSRAAISCGDVSTPWASESGADGPELDDGKVHHMVSTINSDSITLYIDGILQASTPLSSNNKIANISTNFAYLAKSVYDSDPTWRGEIFEFNIYNKALSPNEINFLYKNANYDPGNKPVIVEAESGVLGSFYSVKQEGNITYITTTVNYTGQTGPGDSNRVATYTVTFPDSGHYNLYLRLRVGSGGYNDDSFFYARGFGKKDVNAANDWVFVNGLGGAGFSNPTDVVDGPGTLGSGVWKWVNVSKNTYSGVVGDTFYVEPDNLTKTFQIATREDGLDIDKIAFGKAYLLFTVEALDKGLHGKLPSTDTTTAPQVWRGPALAKGQAKFLGSAYAGSDPNFALYWTQLTPENAGKWGSVGISQDTTQWNWSGLDAAYNYAVTNNLIFKNHTLIWGAQQPSWISNLDSASQAKYIETWIRMVGKRYPKIDMIDVVNEPLYGHNPPDGLNGRANYKKALGGNGKTGWDWVIKSFELARKYLPNTKLLLNDYGIINDNTATTNYLQIINLLKERALIDGIGVQGHRFELENADTNTLKYNLDRLAATGLPIYISELDLGNIGNTGSPDDNQQLQLYKKIFPILWKHPGVKGITLWGYIEGRIWQSTCFLVRSDGSWRPALTWLAQYIKDNPTDIKESALNLPSNYNLEQNYPNPFNSLTTISYDLPYPSKVSLKVYNVLGQEIATIFEGVQPAGNYKTTFDGKNLSSGIYFYRLIANDFVSTKKFILLK